MKNFKKVLALVLVACLSLGILAACGGGDTTEEESAEDKVIKVGASPSPHAEILEQAKSEVEAQGYTLEIVEFEDYVKPNQALTDGDLDANYFQHMPYLNDYNEKNGTDLVGLDGDNMIHFEALAVYKGTKASFDELEDGDKIGVPNDTTNEARALQLLQAEGIITLKEGAGLQATKTDIVDNPKNIEIVELEAAILPSSLPDLQLAVINGNYATGAGLTTDDMIAAESADSEAAQTYGNVIAVRAGDEESEKTQVLLAAVKSDKVRTFIEETYNGAVTPLF